MALWRHGAFAIGQVVMAEAGSMPVIYLINQISGHGHLDMYARLYSKCLLEHGYRVVLISLSDPGVENWFSENDNTRKSFVFFTRDGVRAGDFNPASVQFTAPLGTPSLIARVARRANALIDKLLNRLPARVSGRARSLYARAVDLTTRVGRKLTEGLPRRVRRIVLRMRADGILAGFEPAPEQPPFGVHFGHVADEIREASRRTGWRPSLVLFLYLDMMSQEPGSLADLSALSLPWAGIRFHPDGSYKNGAFSPERYFLCPNARGAIFLNPEPISAYQEKLPHLRVVAFPDVTYADTLEGTSDFVEHVRARARGRRIVLQLGTLSPHKGIFQLIELVKRANPQQFFFVIAGEIFWEHYGARERELRAFIENPPEHCFVRLGYLEDEKELNSLIQASDALYAVYRDDFLNSSNTITKAAVFERPILVRDKFLMGERVKRYGLGEAVAGVQVEDTLFWLEEVVARPSARFGFDACRREQSIDALNAALPAAIDQWLASRKQTAGSNRNSRRQRHQRGLRPAAIS